MLLGRPKNLGGRLELNGTSPLFYADFNLLGKNVTWEDLLDASKGGWARSKHRAN